MRSLGAIGSLGNLTSAQHLLRVRVRARNKVVSEASKDILVFFWFSSCFGADTMQYFNCREEKTTINQERGNTMSAIIPKGFAVLDSRTPNFDWQTLFDGAQHILEHGKDYHCKTDSMVRNAKQKAKTLGIDILIAIRPEDPEEGIPSAVLIQSQSAEQPEPQPEPQPAKRVRKPPTKRTRKAKQA